MEGSFEEVLEMAWEESGGKPDGSASNPWRVHTAKDLENVGKNAGDYVGWTLHAHYRQMDNIDISAVANWTLIGTSGNSFTGTYDGGGKTIRGLTITSGTNRGLFGIIGSGSKVQNIKLTGVNISAGTYAGAVVGFNNGGEVSNCSVSGSIVGTSWYIGGIVGRNDGIVQRCSFSGDVEGDYYVGGIVGQNNGIVQRCSFSGDVEGACYVGGVAGINQDPNISKVINCYATGSVKATSTTSSGFPSGGVVGSNANSGTEVLNCYATNSVTGANVGGICGWPNGNVKNSVALNSSISGIQGANRVVYNGVTARLENNYASTSITSGTWSNRGLNASDGADVSPGETAGQFNYKGFWTNLGWDFDTVWDWDSALKLPVLR